MPIRVLHVIGAMNRGGAETLVMNLYRNINRDRIQFDFLVNDAGDCDYDEEIRRMGGHMYQIPRYDIANYVTYRHACKEFFAQHHYPIVHGHIGLPAPIYLRAARKSGAFCIAHSHAQNFPLSPAELAFRISTYPTRYCADYFLACSEQAGIDRYGRAVMESNRSHILKNGIDLTKAQFNDVERAAIRNELSIPENAPVFGHVCRLTHIKNHSFLLDVFSEIKRKLPEAHLLLAGRGEDEGDLRSKVSELNLERSVHFLGVRSDIPQILSAIDVFVFPSFKEGLPVAVVEAQASGARCLLSTGVPELARIDTGTQFLHLDVGEKEWAHAALEMYSLPQSDRSASIDRARLAGFDISESAHWLSDLYLSINCN